MTILEFPASLKVTGHSLTADQNAGQSILPFSGTVQRLAPTFERFRGVWSFRPPKREDSPEVEAFFLRINGGAALFRTQAFQPARNSLNLSGTVSGAHAARVGEVALTGLPANRSIVAGEWVQIGWQAARVLETTHTNASGAASVKIFPFLHDDLAGGETVRVGRWVKILWRLTGEPVAWSYGQSRHNALDVSLEAVQEIVTASHELASEEVPP